MCIIGAGLAGLRCAEILIGDDIEVTILEARDRLGGRVSFSIVVYWTPYQQSFKASSNGPVRSLG